MFEFVDHADETHMQHPNQDERDALNSYLHLTSRLYPCGECATEFQELLKRFPPQVNSFQLQCSSAS
jgi:hypothetical protein